MGNTSPLSASLWVVGLLALLLIAPLLFDLWFRAPRPLS